MVFWPKSRQSFVGSFVSAFRGLRFALEGRNFVVTIGLGIGMLCASYIFRFPTQDRFTIIISTGLILVAEIFNTAFEKLLDLLIPQHHPEVGKIKDLLAGGVLVFSIIAATIWARMFLRVLLGWSV